MPNNVLSSEVFAEELRALLGGSQVDIELSDDDIRLCASRTLRVYNRYLPFRGRAKLAVTASTKRYRIDHLHTGLLGVADVQFLSQRVTSTVDPFDPLMQTVYSRKNTMETTFGDVMMIRVYAEDAQRVMSAEPEWHGQWERVGGALQYALYIDVPTHVTTECGYSFRCAYQDTDDPATGRLAIPDGDADWFLAYGAALAKQMLSRVRGKHGGVLTSEGGTDTTDADSDRSEAATELEALTNEIKMRKPPYIPVTE